MHAIFSYRRTDQWLLAFFIYCFFGWIFESTYVSLCKHRFVNRGFMRGPFLPLYGSGAILMLFVSIPVGKSSGARFYPAGCIPATALEYVTGVCMEKLFRVRYWDYSKQKFNYKGQICLSSTLAWGGLTIFLLKVIHPPIERFVLGLPTQLVSVVTHVLTALVGVDMALSFKAALDVRDVLVKLTALKGDLDNLQNRANVIVAFAQADMLEKKEELEKRLEERLEGPLAKRLENTVSRLESQKEKLGEKLPEFEGLKTKVAVTREKLIQVKKNGLDFYGRSRLKSSPSATSEEFKEALKMLKESLEERKRKDSKANNTAGRGGSGNQYIE